MSGTSMDSFDAVLVDLSSPQPLLLGHKKTPVPPELKQQLLRLCSSFDAKGVLLDKSLLTSLDEILAQQFAELTRQLLSEQAIDVTQVSAIGSHGQTVFHLPPATGQLGFSIQIAHPDRIAQLTGIRTVGDFRNADMRVGGQGAPLVPAFHQAAFRCSEKNRAIVNIGGMANVTVLPTKGEVRGFDTGPGNVLMDGWIHQHLNRDYDKQGAWASQEKPDHELLHLLLQEPYFQQPPPKSTGRELFNLVWLDKKIATLHRVITPDAVQATLAMLTALTITDALQQQAGDTQEIYICGGGAHNTFLMKLLQQHSAVPVSSTTALGIDPDWVEAMAFAWLAQQHLKGLPGNLPAVTGARSPVVLGTLHPSVDPSLN